VPSAASYGRTSNDDDLFLMTMLGIAGLGSAAAVAAFLWHQVVGWLVAHGVLLPAAAHPLFAVPGGSGAGLDGARSAIAGAVLLLLVALVVGWIRALVRMRRLLA